MSSSLIDMRGKLVSIITNDGRNIVGGLKGYDNMINVVLEGSHERVYSVNSSVEVVSLGLYLIRGDNISLIAELDDIADIDRDLSKIRAAPIKSILQG
mmetsp:Transcript_4127/g.6300  ORF Transcript_4127/g.6300 Transcript_4127/m.6300 type:complete len:98 (+) Transcript_4127:65-358(+)